MRPRRLRVTAAPAPPARARAPAAGIGPSTTVPVVLLERALESPRDSRRCAERRVRGRCVAERFVEIVDQRLRDFAEIRAEILPRYAPRYAEIRAEICRAVTSVRAVTITGASRRISRRIYLGGYLGGYISADISADISAPARRAGYARRGTRPPPPPCAPTRRIRYLGEYLGEYLRHRVHLQS